LVFPPAWRRINAVASASRARPEPSPLRWFRLSGQPPGCETGAAGGSCTREVLDETPILLDAVGRWAQIIVPLDPPRG